MKLDSGIVLLAVGIGALVWWRRGREQPVTATAPTIPLPPAGPASGVQLGAVFDRGTARELALTDMTARFGAISAFNEDQDWDGRVWLLTFSGFTADRISPSAMLRYEWQPADGAVKRL